MPLYRGGQRIAKLYKGSTPIARAYRESTLAYGAAGEAPTATCSYVNSYTSTSSAASYSFNDAAIGAADASRAVVVSAVSSGGTARTISSITVGGNPAAHVVTSGATSGSNFLICGMYILAVPSGTTANIVVNFSGSTNRCAINIYRTTGLTSLAPYDIDDSALYSSITTRSIALDVPRGFAIATAYFNSSTARTAAWTGPVKDHDTDWNSRSITGASSNFEAVQSGFGITVEANDTVANGIALAGASWA